MKGYVPARPFAKIAIQPWANELWHFLNKPKNITRMETAIMLNRAPLEGVVWVVEQKFGPQFVGVENHSHRQMVGHMVGQIVAERFGAQHRNQRTTIRREGSEFKSATKFEFTGAICFGGCNIKGEDCTAAQDFDAVYLAYRNEQPVWVCPNCRSEIDI